MQQDLDFSRRDLIVAAATCLFVPPAMRGLQTTLPDPFGSGPGRFGALCGDAEREALHKELRENALSILDYTTGADRRGVIAGTAAADSAFDKMTVATVARGKPARLPRGSFKLSAQTKLPAGLTLFLDDGAEIFFDDDTLESCLLIEDDDIHLYSARGSRIRGPLTSSSGLTGTCLLVRAPGASSIIIDGLSTYAGKHGLVVLDSDNVIVRNVVARNSYRWAIFAAGTRNSHFSSCGVEVTRDSGASDCFKITGKFNDGIADWSTRSSYNLFFTDCYGKDAAAGQVFDIIGTVDEANDLHHIYVSNPRGSNSTGGSLCGLFEVKLDESGGSFTNYPVHDIHINGGCYFGNGNEVAGGYIADRVYNIFVDGTKINDVQVGIDVANPARFVQLKDVTIVRSRKEGIKWESGGGAVLMSRIIGPTVIDPNYGQGASTYSGINFTAGSHVILDSPAVYRSQEPSGSAHPYGILIGTAANKIMIDGAVSLSGHATAPIDNSSTTGGVTFPDTIK